MSETHAQGIQFYQVSAADAAVFDRVADIYDYTNGDATADTYEDSLIDAVDEYKQFAGGMIDPGETELKLRWKPSATADAAYNRLRATLGKTSTFQVRLPDRLGKVSITFVAVVVSVSDAFPANDKAECTVKFKRSGKPVDGVWV